MKKLNNLDDIWWKSINVPPYDVRKIMDGTKTSFISRERYGEKYPKRRFWKNDYVFVRELWHKDFFSQGFIYEADNRYDFVNWNPPQQMPQELARIFLKITKVERKRIRDLNSKDMMGLGVDSSNFINFINHWNNEHWRKGDRWEDNPMVRIHKFRRIHIKKYGDGPIIKPKYAKSDK